MNNNTARVVIQPDKPEVALTLVIAYNWHPDDLSKVVISY